MAITLPGLPVRPPSNAFDGTQRLEQFSDGVFSIVITLLVLGIALPAAQTPNLALNLPQIVLDMWPKFVSYAISFVIVGMYWVGHHYMFLLIQRSDRTLMWLNILFLMFVSFLPFPTSVLGQYWHTQTAVVLYGVGLILCSGAMGVMWYYVTHNRMLLEQVTISMIRAVWQRTLVVVVVAAIAIGLSFVSVYASLAMFIALTLVYMLPTQVDPCFNKILSRDYENLTC